MPSCASSSRTRLGSVAIATRNGLRSSWTSVADRSARRHAASRPRAHHITRHMKGRCVMSYLKCHGTRRVPQWAPLPGQAPNPAGGFAGAADACVRGGDTVALPRLLEGFARAQEAASPRDTAALVREYRLPREALKPEHLTSPEVWEALLVQMPMTALIRNLATMTRVGVIAPGSDGTAKAVAQLGDAERIRRARVHPIAVLAALRTYASGRGARGRGEWSPVGGEAGAGGRRRAGRRVLHGVRQRRAGGQAAAARPRRVGLHDHEPGRRR